MKSLVAISTYRAYGSRVSDIYDSDPYDGFGGQYGYYKDREAGPWLYLIKRIKRCAYGFRNFEHFALRVLVECDGAT